ncbi:MAG: YiiX/YebB-like N1pC/P60 family cysteine hydrolase [Bacteroidota bacterium]|nr:YiiX/YebB-like N1pC/P60 family cysteine hydrolase [Bacteroidota bacterium]
MSYLLQNEAVFGIILIMILSLSLTFMVACHEVNSNEAPIWNQLSLEEGDIVYRRGSSLASQVVLASDTRGNYSHIGIIVRDSGAYKVVHAVPGESEPGAPDLVKMDPLRDFFADNRAVAGEIMRLEMNDSLRSLVAENAKDCYFRDAPFDHHYDLSGQTELYCTELIWFVFKTIDIDITRNSRTHVNFLSFKGDFIFPSDISNNTNLISIYSFNNH